MLTALLCSLLWLPQGGGIAIDVSQQRLDIIWSHAYSRMSTQTDWWFKRGDFPRSIQQLRMTYELDPTDYHVASDLAWMLENVQDYDEARKIYERYQRDNPEDPDRGLPQAQSHFTRREYAEAIKILEPMLSDDAHPNVFRILAHSYNRVGRLRDSLNVWDRYLRLHPNDEAGKRNRDRVAEELRASGGGR